MKKTWFFLLLMLLGAFSSQAEEWPDASQVMPLPLNPAVKHGVLENGINYYILHNEEPKGKANFYIAQKVGSTQEAPDQLGLAHFLEHMAFNGLEHFPGKSMLEYLQSKGIRFGADINAGTGYDFTVYNINNVPTSDKNLMDSTLLVLYDWSGGILLEESEIEAERGVIREEMRMSEDAMQRMLNKISPEIFPEYAYQHPIIGTEEVIMNFKPEVIRAYYKKWYRPDLQGIIIVGDFDADAMEKNVVELFSKIPAAINPAERVYPPFTGNEEPIYSYYSDPEMRFPMAMIFFKEEPVPFEIRNSVQMYIGVNLMQTIIAQLINQRLNEYSLNPDCLYSSAFVEFGNYLISKAASAFTIEVYAKSDINAAVSEVMSIVAQACKAGFTETEYDRVKENLLSSLENRVKEKDKTNNNILGRQLCSTFTDNTPNPGIEQEYMLWQQMLPMLPLEAIDEACQNILSPENMVVVVAEPEKEGMVAVAKEVVLGSISNALNADYEAYEDESIDEPLIASLPQPGKVVNKTSDTNIGTTVYTLSNGVEVIVKPTDFSADEIIFKAVKKGGKEDYSEADADNVLMVDDVYSYSKFGPFDKKTLTKYLAGKKVSLEYDINTYNTTLGGNSTVKDLNVLMELIYTTFTNLQPDETSFISFIERIKPVYANIVNDPDYIFQQKSEDVIYNDNPLMATPSLEILENVNYNKALDLIKKSLSNAADYTFVFVGNVEEDALIPLMEQYIATLPAQGKKASEIVTKIEMKKGQVEDRFKQKMQTPQTTILNLYSGYNVPYTTKNYILTSMLGKLVMSTYLESLREDEGGTYTPQVIANYSIPLGAWILQYQIKTDPAKTQSIIDRANLELDKIFAEGTDIVNYTKIHEADLQQYQNMKRNNRYWNNLLVQQVCYPQVDFISEYEGALNSITLEDFNNFLKTVYNGDNRIQIIMESASE